AYKEESPVRELRHVNKESAVTVHLAYLDGHLYKWVTVRDGRLVPEYQKSPPYGWAGYGASVSGLRKLPHGWRWYVYRLTWLKGVRRETHEIKNKTHRPRQMVALKVS